MVERDRSGVLYNTQLIAAPTGLIGGYRKTHVGNSEIHRFSHGDELRVFDYAGVSFGILICYDNHFPEASRTLALRGAEVIFSRTARRVLAPKKGWPVSALAGCVICRRAPSTIAFTWLW